jgi:hypothetical protein
VLQPLILLKYANNNVMITIFGDFDQFSAKTGYFLENCGGILPTPHT